MQVLPISNIIAIKLEICTRTGPLLPLFSICYGSRLKLTIRRTMKPPKFDIFCVTCEQLEWVTQMNLLFYLISVNVITRLKAEQNATNNKLNIIWPQL